MQQTFTCIKCNTQYCTVQKSTYTKNHSMTDFLNRTFCVHTNIIWNFFVYFIEKKVHMVFIFIQVVKKRFFGTLRRSNRMAKKRVQIEHGTVSEIEKSMTEQSKQCHERFRLFEKIVRLFNLLIFYYIYIYYILQMAVG